MFSPGIGLAANTIKDQLLGNIKSVFSMVPGKQDAYNVKRGTICHPKIVLFFKKRWAQEGPSASFSFLFFLLSKKSSLGQMINCFCQKQEPPIVFHGCLQFLNAQKRTGQQREQRGRKMPVGSKTHPGAKQTCLIHRGKQRQTSAATCVLSVFRSGSWQAPDGQLTLSEKPSVL